MRRETVITSGLLHDVGKIIYRAIPSEARKGKGHQELGYNWAQEMSLPPAIQEVIKLHHMTGQEHFSDSFEGEPEIKNLLYLISEANNIAAGMGNQQFDSKGISEVSQGLGVIFDTLSLSLEGKQRQQHSWQPKMLEDTPYPVPDQEVSEESVLSFYKTVWASLYSALKDPKNLQEDRLLLLLEKFLSQVPEHTYRTDESWSDTSLYHHLKSTASIAWCVYLYLSERGYSWEQDNLKDVIDLCDEKRFLLVGADLSGIQNFIYTVSSRAALKTVKARSFFLDLLIESAVTQLYHDLDLCRCNVIYASGGGFYLLAPNILQIQEKIGAFQKEFNTYLYENFGTSLYLCLNFAALSGNTLKGDQEKLQLAWENLHRKLRLEKSQKWKDFIDDPYFFGPWSVHSECEICHRSEEIKKVDMDELSIDLCPFCQSMIKLGKHLSALDSFYEVDSDINVPDSIKIHNCTYVFERPPQVKTEYQLCEPWQIPDVSWPVVPFPVGSYQTQDEFQELAQCAFGDKKIGILRMDVDRLGRLFAAGIKNVTFARLSDLSARLNIYFKYYLPRLLVRTTGGFLPVAARKIPINIVYSGGDDLFLVGTWDAALEAAWAINDDFRRYTGNNPDITISGGVVVSHEKVAFYKLADLAADEESGAKDAGRNRLCCFGFPLKWDELQDLISCLSLFCSGMKQERLTFTPIHFSKSFFYNFTALIEEHNFLKKTSQESPAWIYPKLYYLFARAKLSAKSRAAVQFYQSLLAICLDEKVMVNILPPVLRISKLMLRGAVDGG